MTEINVISNAFLKAHGVPDEMLAEASKYGSDEVLEVSARRMVEVGAIKYLMADGKIIATGPKAAVP